MKTKFETVSCLTYTDNGFAFIHPEQGLVKLSYLFSPPYFYIARESARIYQKVPFCSKPQNCGLKGDDGRQVYKVFCKKPGQVKTAKEIYGVRNTYEADIQYLLRLQIDGTIRYRMDPNRIVYLDLETDDSTGFPDPERAGEYRILSVSIVDSDSIPYTYYYGDYDSEIEFLQAVLKLLEVLGATVMVGWNVMFDYRHLLGRAEYFGLDTTWLRTMYPLDLRGFYKKNVPGLESYTLEEASQHTLGAGKIERTSRVVDLPRDKLLEYNERDALLVYEIDKELNLSKEPLIVSDYLGVSPCNIYVRWDKWESMDRHLASRVGDVVIIRRLRELGYVARSRWHKPEDYKDITYQGALVGDPIPGLYENVAVYDFESLYPNVIIHEKIDVADFSGEVLPYIEETLLNYRREQKKKCKEGDEVACNIQYAVKIVLNCFTDKEYIVTEEGIKKFKDVRVGEKVLSINPSSGVLEWDIVTDTWEYDYDGEIYCFKRKRSGEILFCATPEQRLILRDKNGKLRFFTVKEVYDMSISKRNRLCFPKPLVDYNDSFNYIDLRAIALQVSLEYGSTPYLYVKAPEGVHLRSFKNILPDAIRRKLENASYDGNQRAYRLDILELTRDEILTIERYGGQVYIKTREKSNPIKPIVRDVDLLFVMGLYLSEGSVYISKPRRFSSTVRGISYKVQIPNKDSYLGSMLKKALANLGIPIMKDQKTRSGVTVYSFSSDVLGYLFKQYVGVYAREKRVPRWVFKKSSRLGLWALMIGLYWGDGRRVTSNLQYRTQSKELAKDFAYLSMLLGYLPSIRMDGDMFTVAIKEKRGICFKSIDIVKQHYSGKIFDVTTKKNHTILVGRNEFNFTGQSLYGLTGTISYRYFDVEKASRVTSGARKQLNKLISIVRDDGKEVIYYDTDSSFILMGSDQEYEAYEELLNRRLAPYRLKWEYTFTRILFLEAKTGEGSAKKRYIGYTHDGKLVYKGLPLVRKDYPRWIKEAFKRIYLAVLDGYTQHQLKELVRELRKELYSGRVDEQLIVCKGIQRGKEYKVKAQHLKAWDKLLERGWYRGLDRVCYVITRGMGGRQEPEPVSPEGRIPHPWYAYYWKTVEEEYHRVVRSVWGSPQRGARSLSEFF